MKGFIEILFVLAILGAFFFYEVYASLWFWIGLVIVVIISSSELIRHYTYQLLAVVFGVFYLPMNMFLEYLTKVIEPFKKEDVIAYTILRILFFPVQLAVIIFSIPYEWVLDRAH